MKDTNRHTYAYEDWQAFHEGQLPSGRRAEMELHLRTCADCQKVLSSLERLDLMVADAEQATVPPGYSETFASRVASRIAQSKPAAGTKTLTAFHWKWLSAALAASLVATIFLVDVNRQKQLAPKPPAVDVGEVRKATGSYAFNEPPPASKKETAPRQPTEGGDRLMATAAKEQEKLEQRPAAAPATALSGEKSSPVENQDAAAGRSAVISDATSTTKIVSSAELANAPRTSAAAMPRGSLAHAKAERIEVAGKLQAKDARPIPSPPAPRLDQAATAPAAANCGVVDVIIICLPDHEKTCPSPQAKTAIVIPASRL